MQNHGPSQLHPLVAAAPLSGISKHRGWFGQSVSQSLHPPVVLINQNVIQSLIHHHPPTFPPMTTLRDQEQHNMDGRMHKRMRTNHPPSLRFDTT